MNTIPWKLCSVLWPLRYREVTKSYCSVSGTNVSSINYCIDLIQKNDHENYLCTALLPVDLKLAGIAVRAFNVEIATIADQVSEKIIGEMRFQFWQDSIDKIYAGNIPQHPVCILLAKAIHRHLLSKVHLKRLIQARRKHLVSPIFNNLEHAEEYCDSSNTPTYLLLLEAAGIKKIDSDHASSHLGRAQGLANILRSTIYHSRRNKVVLPQELLLKYNVSQEQVLRHTVSKNMKDVAFDIATQIHHHLQHVKILQKKIDRVSKRILLPRVCIENYLKNLRQADFDIFHPTLQKKSNSLSFKLLVNRILFC